MLTIVLKSEPLTPKNESAVMAANTILTCAVDNHDVSVCC